MAAKARAIMTLLLPTAHFVRVLVERRFRIGELHLFEQGGPEVRASDVEHWRCTMAVRLPPTASTD